MRRIIFFFMFILLIPFTAFAEECRSDGVTIQSIEMVDKSTGSSELTKAKTDGTILNLDLEFGKIDDYIKYNVTVKNNTDVDYVLDESMFNKKYSNVSYTFETDNKIVKAHQTRDITLNVQLINIPGIGKFNETNTFSINLTGGKLKNPPTGIKNLLYYLPVIVISGLIITYAVKRKKIFKAMIILIGLIVSVPFIVKAACKCNLTVESKITYENCKYKLVTDEGSFDGADEKELCLGPADVMHYSDFNMKILYNSYDHYSSEHPYAFVYLVDGRNLNFEPLFKDSSYIKLYSDADKTHLIKTITKSDLLPHYYSVSYGDFIDEVSYFLIGKYENVFYEISPDLEDKIHIRISYGTMDNYKTEEDPDTWAYKAPIVINQDIIDKIEYLAKNGPLGDNFSFTNCNNASVCEGNIFHADWGGDR